MGMAPPANDNPAAAGFALTMVPPKGVTLPSAGTQTGAPLISPDGTSVVIGTGLRKLNSLQAILVRGMTGIGNESFWSPDSKSVAFTVGSRLRKVRVPDGAAEEIVQLPGLYRGGAWSPDGTILVAVAEAGTWGLYVLPPGGSFTRVAVPGFPDGFYFHPEFLPDGSDILFEFRAGGSYEGELYLATLKNGQILNPTRLMKNDSAAHYTPAGGGRVLYVRNDSLYSQKLNLAERKLEGDAELIQPGVASAPGVALADFSVSRSGLIAWRPGVQAYSQVTIFDRQGKQVGTAGPHNDFQYLRLSPDETHLLGRSVDAWTQLLECDRPGLLGLGEVDWELWSPDGLRLLGRQGTKIVERSVSVSGEIRTLTEAPMVNFLEDVSPDGKTALYTSNTGGERSAFSIRLDMPESRATPVVQTGEEILNPRFSPDGRWIVYDVRTAADRRVGISVQPFPGPGLRRQIASDGAHPVWRKDGKEILYIVGGTKIVSIAVSQSGNDLRFSSPTPLFEVRSLNTVVGRTPVAVSRDGSRIFFPQAPEPTEDANVIHITSGWEFKKP
jgi:Tol biopolymer transport system component